MKDSGQERHPTARDKGNETIVPDNVDTPKNDELSSGSLPNLSPIKSSKARSCQRHSHCLAFSNADNGTFCRVRRETGRGKNHPDEAIGNASALPMGIVPPMPLVYPTLGTGPMLYIPPTSTIWSPYDMLSSPIRRHILDYEPPRGFVIPTFTMFDNSTDPYGHMLHYNQAMSLNAGNDLLLCKVFSASLQGPKLAWFHKLSRSLINTFNELWGAFISQHLCSMR